MTTNLESRIAALETKLAPVDPDECTVMVLVLGKPGGTTDPVQAYSAGDGHTILREPDETDEAFEDRAVEWVRREYPPRHPNCGIVLAPVDNHDLKP